MSHDEKGSPPVLVGESPAICEIRRKIEKLGRSRCPVLLLGETGTGKEVVARLIHEAGGQGRFVPIDCSAMTPTLLESELFGHVRGAFTGAASNKTGLLELAHGGTAFFDEIGELPPEMQVKLLRVLQDRRIRPLGSLEWRQADFRVIAATNRDLAAEVERGSFRRDLYYRLNVVTLRLPPLRERREDIPALVAHFLGRHGGQRRLAPDLEHALLSYPWPGNVRELENCIERLVALNSGPVLHLADLPSALVNYWRGSRERAAAAAADASPAGSKSAVLPLEEVEKRAILEALAHTGGDHLKAARLLGIGRTTLYRKLRQYGVGAQRACRAAPDEPR
ncbi:MAG: sigma-54 dependent transcriptional regulator [Bryobacterales bacterium]|nr:sigma-54 dependent transcriptional regulator [Bryobacterales bacterium]